MSIEDILSTLSGINQKFDSFREDVDLLMEERRARSRSPRRKSPASARRASGGFTSDRPLVSYSEATRTNWADRDSPMDFSAPISFSDEEDGGDEYSELLVEVSEKTEKLLKDSCTRSMTNESRKRTRNNFKLPKVSATRTPRLDDFIKAETHQSAKSLDKDLARIQSFVLDALAPLTALVESGDSVTPENLQLASTSAIRLLGNANARISRLRREKIVTSINKSLLPLVKEDSSYSDVSPDLFGADFAKRSKDFLDQVKALRSSMPSKDYKKSLFRKGQSSGRTGANYRGGASNRYNHQRGGNHGGGRQARQDNRQ